LDGKTARSNKNGKEQKRARQIGGRKKGGERREGGESSAHLQKYSIEAHQVIGYKKEEVYFDIVEEAQEQSCKTREVQGGEEKSKFQGKYFVPCRDPSLPGFRYRETFRKVG